MKLLDKLKNALFEEEYVEVEEKPKRKEIKKEKVKKEEKPIAKKIIQPEIKEEKIEQKVEKLDEILEEDIIEEKENKNDFRFPMVSDSEFDTGNVLEEPPQKPKQEKIKKEEKSIYQGKSKKESKPYGLDEIEIPVHEYGAYEKREERTYFKPSPIISPIYGILDKNYTKDEIVQKKEIRLTSSYARENINVDDVRKKAFGTLTDEIISDIEEPITYNEEYDNEEENQLLDLRSDSDTPEVKKVTMGDAEEYFEDLGLEYNVDYKDSSTERVSKRRTRDDYEQELDYSEPKIIEETKITEVEIYEDSNENSDEDNLFDLIDSMYDKE